MLVGAAAVAAGVAGAYYLMPVKVQGRVQFADGTPVTNAKVALLYEGNIVQQVDVNADGTFSFEVKRGNYELMAVITGADGQMYKQLHSIKAPVDNMVLTF